MSLECERGFYQMYLGGLCDRRAWPKPYYQAHQPQPGYWTCIVRVNNREYSTDVAYARKDLAQESAATRAYMICRNFSVNDGMYPGQRLEAGAQGMPVAIGAGRKTAKQTTAAPNGPSTTTSGRALTGTGGSGGTGSYVQLLEQSTRCADGNPNRLGGGKKRDSYDNYSEHMSSRDRSSTSGSSSSAGGESPRSVDSAIAFGKQHQLNAAVAAASSAATTNAPPQPPCRCRRGLAVYKHGMCCMCLRDAGWRA
ncbi:hypothetical protein AAFC00_004947 [Neodothiora populina]|uniref:DRBM domain-containing protein n=1 Tax=Neodothiora populina TaxID=2781224 RepID=A0ABR3P529_9PEZI